MANATVAILMGSSSDLEIMQPAADVLAELRSSHDHVRRIVSNMSSSLATEIHGEVWTSVKALRRLAWHERGELAAMHDLAQRHARFAVE